MATDINTITDAVFPKITIWGSTLVTTVSWIILIFVFVLISAVIVVIFYHKKTYKHKIILFEDDGTSINDVSKDYAKEIKFGDLGLNIFYARKHKKYLPRPSIQSGKNKWYFLKRSNDMWYNVRIKSTDRPDTLTFETIDKSLLERNVGIRNGLEKRFQKGDWLKQNAVMLVGLGVIIILVVFGWLYADKLISMTKEVRGVTAEQKEIASKQADMMSSLSKMLDSIQGGYIRPNG